MNYYLCYADINLNSNNDNERIKKKGGYYKPTDYRIFCRKLGKELKKNNAKVAFYGVVSRLSISRNRLSKWHCHITLIADSMEELNNARNTISVFMSLYYTSYTKAYKWTVAYNNLQFFLYDLPQQHGSGIFYNNSNFKLHHKDDFAKLISRGDMLNIREDCKNPAVLKRYEKSMINKIISMKHTVHTERLVMELYKLAGEVIANTDLSKNPEAITQVSQEYEEALNAYLQGLDGMI